MPLVINKEFSTKGGIKIGFSLGVAFNSGLPVVAKTITAGGRNYQATANSTSFSAAQTRDASSEFNTALATNTLNRSVPLAARAGTTFNEDPLYSNRPRIEIIEDNPLSTDISNNIKYTFQEMILGTVQENDAEKTDVIETFGAPHLFASGRFVRRYSFAGMVRTAPVNRFAQAPELQVPQSVLLRNFYDKYMRASMQAQNGWYTRITINSEIYEGFAHTYNLVTEAQQDGIAPFVFSFIGFRRRHASLDSLADTVLKKNDPGKPGPTAADQRKMDAEVQEAVGTYQMDVTPASADLGVVRNA